MSEYRHIYVHVPFCEVICHYCHFYTARSKEALYPQFFAALERELSLYADSVGALEAIYFGGGTPAASPPELLHGFLAKLLPKISAHTEITLEANPASISPELARAWRNAGFNRVSLGVQSLNDAALKRLGRAHSAAEARQALENCVREIENVSCDLMYAVPEQEEAEPAKHAEELADRGAKHISAYHLTLEENHFLYPQLPTDSLAWKQMARMRAKLEPRGFHHYEVASFALPGRESVNNKNYWSGGPYLALGPSAHGFDGGQMRWRNVSDWREYIRRLEVGELPVSARESLTLEQRRMEILFTAIRTSEGLDMGDYQRRFGKDLRMTHRALLEKWQNEGLIRLANEHLVLTFEGRMLADEITKALL